MFAENPQHVLSIQDAPNGRERVAIAEIDAADQPARRRNDPRSLLLDPHFSGHLMDHTLRKIGVDQSFHGLEAASVLLVEPGPAERTDFFVEKRPADARNLFGADFETEPIRTDSAHQ